MRGKNNIRGTMLLALLSGGGVAVALADEAPATPPPGATPQVLEEVVVTATKRDESVRKINSTVDVIKGQDLEKMGAREMEDFIRYVPGITLEEGNTATNRTVSIRGIGPQPGANQTTGSLVDDVSVSEPYLSYLVVDLDPFDLRDLEVLKGPQGTLFGASALNGAIRYVLNKPVLGTWEGKGFVDWLHIQGAGSGQTYGAALNIPIGQTFALRGVDLVQEIPGLYSDYNADGVHMKDNDNGYKRMRRLLAAWQPLQRLSINALYLEQHSHRNDASVANNFNGDFVHTDEPGPYSATSSVQLANLDARYAFDWATLISETSRVRKSQDVEADGSVALEALGTAGVQTLRLSYLAPSSSVSEEIRLVSPPGDSPWKWIGGVYLFRYTSHFNSNTYLANTGQLATVLLDLGLPSSLSSQVAPDAQGVSIADTAYNPLKANENSVFGELTRKLWHDRIGITLGGRLYRETLGANVEETGLVAGVEAANGSTGFKSMKAEGFNPKLSLGFQATPDLYWYATAAHGFQFGGLNSPPLPIDNYPTSYKPSTVWSYESGLRTDSFHHRLQADFALFELNWSGMQLGQKTSDSLGSYTTNVGSARSKGIESTIRYLTPIKGLTLTNVAAYIHAKIAVPYQDYTYNVTIPAGADLPASPRLQTTTTLAYSTVLGPARAGAGLSFVHQGHAYSDITHQTTIYRYNTLDFNGSLAFPQLFMAPTVTINVTNINNQRSLVGGQVDSLDGVPDGMLGAYLRPRTIALRLGGEF